MEFDVGLMIPDERLSIDEGAIVAMGWQSVTDEGSFTRAIMKALAEEYHFSLSTPFQDYPQEIRDIIIHGTNGHSVKVHYRGQRGEGVYDIAFEGLIRNMQKRYRETGSDTMKQQYEEFMQITPCKACKGQRLKPSSLAVTVADKNIYEITNLSIVKLQEFLQNMQLSERQLAIGSQILKEIKARIQFLMDVGLDYLALSRATATLSGGEAQRTAVARALINSPKIIFADEPTGNLDSKNADDLHKMFFDLRDKYNQTFVIVTHNPNLADVTDRKLVMKDGLII